MKILIKNHQLKKLIEQFEGIKKEFSFSPENLAKEIVKQNIKHPDVALAQSMLETGHFKSRVFIENNNLFGMRKPEIRKTTAVGEKNNHALYDSWIDSVKDYKLWQDARNLSGLSKNEYIDKLRKIYCMPPKCSSKNYSATVNSLLSRANQLLQNKSSQNMV